MAASYPDHIAARMAKRGFFASTVRSLTRRGLDSKANLEAAYERDLAAQAEGEYQGRRFGRARRTGAWN